MKEGDTVIVDKEFANGGYEAILTWVGKYFVTIKSDGEEWDIMKNRVELKSQTDGKLI